MIGIVIVAHGGLAQEYLSALSHVVGPMRGMRAVGVGDGDDRRSRQQEICAAADDVDEGQGVVVVTDLFGGSPSNLAMPACTGPDRVIIYGANLPLLVKLAKSRHLPVATAVAAATAAGRKYIDSFDVQGELAARRRAVQ